MTAFTQSEKLEIIKLVEESDLGVKKTLADMGIPRSTFYNWYDKYRTSGPDALQSGSRGPRRYWNKIPDKEKKYVVKLALKYPDKSPRELALFITDKHKRFISKSSVYKILKEYDLITSHAYYVIKAGAEFKDKTTYVNQMWQTDFTYFKILNWGWCYLATVIDDYSRYVISWKLFSTMKASDVKEVLDLALAKTGLDQVMVKHKPRLLSDNGPCYLSDELKTYLEDKQIEHRRGAPYHPQTQGKIERYHRTIKNQIKLTNYYYPGELEDTIKGFVEYYNNERYHESINNLKPVDVFNGLSREILTQREVIKEITLRNRRKINLKKAS